MNSPDHVLSLLGLALRGGRLAVGEEPVEAVCRAKHCRLLLMAADAADNTRRRARHFSEAGACILLTLPHTKADLGRAVGRASAAVVAVTDIGLAAAVARRLAELDPARYGAAVTQLDTKARRAQQRRDEQRAHEKNVRTGKYKAAPPQQKKEDAPPPEEKRPAPRRSAAPKKTAPKTSAQEKGAPSQRRKPPASGAAHRRPGQAKPNPYAHSRPVKKGKGSNRG